MSSTESQAEHAYGPRVNILSDPWIATAVARIGSPETPHTTVVSLLRNVYTRLTLEACASDFPRTHAEVPTRMAAAHPKAGVYRGPVLDPATRVVVVDVIRGGMIPSQHAFELLSAVLPFEQVRLDHLNLQRRTDAAGHVTGVDLFGSKVGGSVENAVLVLPDPMGATGSTVLRVLEHYLEHHGRPQRVVVVPMIATPEFLRCVLDCHEELSVTTARIDRGLSPPDVLARAPGELWERERGLDEKGYIVPGAGGMGEVLNNSWC